MWKAKNGHPHRSTAAPKVWGRGIHETYPSPWLYDCNFDTAVISNAKLLWVVITPLAGPDVPEV